MMVTFPCFFSFVGLVNKILSASFWIPLSRLTYCAYLVHIIALVALSVSYETAQAYSDVHTVSNMCPMIVMNLTCLLRQVLFSLI